MPSSNTPSDLKNLIVRASDAACTNATGKNLTRRLSRSFGNIKGLARLLFQPCDVGQPAMEPARATRQSREQSAAFLLFSQSGRIRAGGENVLRQAETTRGISATFALLRELELNFFSLSFCCYQTRSK